MKIESIAVHHQDVGNLVTVAFRFQENEALEAEDIVRLFDLLNEIGGQERNLKITTDTSREALKTAEEPAPQPTEGRRRRRGNALGSPEAAAGAGENPTETPAPPQSDGIGAGRRTRRSRTAEQASAGDATGSSPTISDGSQSNPSTAPNVSKSEPAQEPTRRRRRSAEAAPSADTPLTSEPSEVGRRRRRADPAASTEASPATSPSDISDADLSKAASLGAQKLTPKVVQAYLHELGVKSVNELKGGQRRAFLDGIKAKMEAAS